MTVPRIADARQREIESIERLAKKLQHKSMSKFNQLFRDGQEDPDAKMWWVVQHAAQEALDALKAARKAPGRGLPFGVQHPHLDPAKMDHLGVPEKIA